MENSKISPLEKSKLAREIRQLIQDFPQKRDTARMEAITVELNKYEKDPEICNMLDAIKMLTAAFNPNNK